MIGLFDSGHGGLTVFRALTDRFPDTRFTYLGDHANAPIGNRSGADVTDITRANVERLFGIGCRLVILACNTATTVACRQLQQSWLPNSSWAGTHNVLGIVAPTVEVATQMPWAVQTPQYPQSYNTDLIAVFGTRRTVTTDVYPEEIRKRCPRARVIQQACPHLVDAIEGDASGDEIRALVAGYVAELMEQTGGEAPDRAILGCTHYPLVQADFIAALPATTKLLAQPAAVADSLENYLTRHPHYAVANEGGVCRVFTTGDPDVVTRSLGARMPHDWTFEALPEGASPTA